MTVDRGWSPQGAARIGRPPIGWGLPDTLLAWVAGLVASALAVLPWVDPDEGTVEGIVPLLVALVVQSAAILAVLVAVSRTKGRRRLRLDFGLVVRPRDAAWLALGGLFGLLTNVLLLPIVHLADLDESPQEVTRRLEDAAGLELAFFALAVVAVAPVVEELLFRGALQRALQRRTSPGRAVFAAAVLFGAVHLTDPGSYPVLPGLVGLGIVTGVVAVRSGDLSRPILLHAGFNLLTVLGVLADR
ncbi:MAG: CPBP family intramembrane metalloprotease [Acidimicrobiia bacterium]|nr:CPBP family intramembrane metalloprotease [Acidimicrobiia bacterium]